MSAPLPFPINTTIPATLNDPADDQPGMQTNFSNINSYLMVDHIQPGATNNGYHRQVHMMNQAAPGLAGADGVLYNNLINGNSWPIWQNALGSTTMISSATNNSTNGFASLPGGMLIQWGVKLAPGASGTISFLTDFLTATQPFTIQLTPVFSGNISGSYGVLFGVASNSSFSYLMSNGPLGVANALYWLAIGRQI